MISITQNAPTASHNTHPIAIEANSQRLAGANMPPR
jgi:hypothetical protein